MKSRRGGHSRTVAAARTHATSTHLEPETYELLKASALEHLGQNWGRKEILAALCQVRPGLTKKQATGILQSIGQPHRETSPNPERQSGTTGHGDRQLLPTRGGPQPGRSVERNGHVKATSGPVPAPRSRDNPVADAPPLKQVLGSCDEGWLGLALLSRELQLGWRSRDWGELGFWRPVRGHGPPPTDGRGFSAWKRAGGSGRYLLNPEALSAFFKAAGLNPERVLCDLADRRITETDRGHATKPVWFEGALRRMIVLPDGYVQSRRDESLPSAVKHRKGLDLGRRGPDGPGIEEQHGSPTVPF